MAAQCTVRVSLSKRTTVSELGLFSSLPQPFSDRKNQPLPLRGMKYCLILRLYSILKSN